VIRERALTAVLVVVGLLFLAAVYPVLMSFWRPSQWDIGGGVQMMLSLYFTLGIFLLLAVPNPAAHRSLIAFTAWSSFAHGLVMAVLGYQSPDDRVHLLGGALGLFLIGIVVLALSPGKSALRSSAVGA
jgi:hypothetical protein